jgi:hypothetical protein
MVRVNRPNIPQQYSNHGYKRGSRYTAAGVSIPVYTQTQFFLVLLATESDTFELVILN